MMLVLDKPEVEEIQTSESKFCHIYCTVCGPPLGVCGAYKPIPCGGLAIDSINQGYCNVCNLEPCPDCVNELVEDQPCFRCGV